MMMGVRRVAGSRRKRRQSSMPLMPGNIKSRMIKRGGSRSLNAADKPASPVGAVTAGSPSRSKLYFKLSEISASSSMIRIGRLMLIAVFDERGFSHVDGQLTYVCDVITDAFQVLGDEEQPRIARGGRRLSDHQLDQAMKRVVVKIVDGHVALDDLARHL